MSLKLSEANIMVRIIPIFGIGSPSRTEISDDESSQSGASEVATPAPKQDKKAKSKTPVAEEDEDRLMVDSDKDDDDEEEELGEDE